MTKKKCSALIDLIEYKFKQQQERLNNNKKLNEVEEVRQKDMRKLNIIGLGQIKKNKKRKKKKEKQKYNCNWQCVEAQLFV